METMELKLKWGDGEAYREAVRRIVSQPNEFYSTLAKGVEKAALKYGEWILHSPSGITRCRATILGRLHTLLF